MESLYNVTRDVKQAAEIIIQNMIVTRPRGELKYRPYRVSEVVTQEGYLGWENVDLKKVYPDVKLGDCVYIGMNLVSGTKCQAALTVKGKVKVYLEEKEVNTFKPVGDDGSVAFYMDVKKGNNNVVLLCECEREDGFVISYIPSTTQYLKMWARDYLLYLGVFSPVKEFSAEEGIGISRIYHKGEILPMDSERDMSEKANIEYVWPKLEHIAPELDFDMIFSEGKGMVCYALTNMVMTSLGAFFLSIKGPRLNGVIAMMIVFTMYFSGGLVPAYLNMKDLGLLDNRLALILPGAISTTNLIILKSAFQSVPDSLLEAARLDGASYFHILTKVMIPLSKATLAVLVLYYGVGHWNAWFNASIYIRKKELQPLQLIMRQLLAGANQSMMTGAGADEMALFANHIKYALIVVGTAPILVLYPFLQKYFVKGVMIGAVKG